MRRRTLAVSGVAVVTLAAGTGIAVASIPSGSGVFHACSSKHTGRLRLIDPSQGQHCAFNPATDPGISAPQFHFNPTTCLIDVSHDFSRLTYTVSADWKPAPGKLLYVAHRLGYRAGAWSTRAIVSQGVTITAPEIVRDYEVGAKLDWHPGDTFLRTNIAAYHQDYSNIQRLVPFQLGFTTGTNFVNAQKATINGVEGEVSFEPVRGLQLSAFTAYTDAHFNKFLYPSVLGGPLDTDITKVAEFGGVSRWQAGGTVSVDLPTPETIGRGHFTASYYFQSSYWLQDNTTRSPDDKTPSYNLVNARLELNHIAGSKVSAAVIGNKTAIDAAIAAPERTLTPTTNMPQRAMHTVSPAKSTARPAVAPAVVTASSTERPRRRPARARVRMNSE